MKFSITTADSTQFTLGILMLVGAVIIPALLVLIWALAFKKKRRRRRRRESRMNPTLAHTGGLPPLRRRENVTDQPKS
jgi:hypothetical protein